MIRAIYISYLLFKEALHRLTGLRRDASVPTTLFTAGMVAASCEQLAGPLMRRAQGFGRPSLATGIIASGVLRAGARRVGGEELRELPYAREFITAAMILSAWRLVLVPVRVLSATFARLARFLRSLIAGVPRPTLRKS